MEPLIFDVRRQEYIEVVFSMVDEENKRREMGRIRSWLNIVVDSSFYALLFQVYVDCGREIVGEEEDVPLIQLLHDMPWCLKFVVASDTDILSWCFSGCKKKFCTDLHCCHILLKKFFYLALILISWYFYVLWPADFALILQKCAWLAIDWILIFCLGTMLVARPFLFFQVPHLLLPQYTV